MKPRALWIGCFALGAYNALLFGIGGVLFAALSFLFALPLVIRGRSSLRVVGIAPRVWSDVARADDGTDSYLLWAG